MLYIDTILCNCICIKGTIGFFKSNCILTSNYSVYTILSCRSQFFLLNLLRKTSYDKNNVNLICIRVRNGAENVY